MRNLPNVILAIALTCTCASGDDEKNGSSQTENSPPLKVELLLPSSPVEAGTPSVFKFKITNTSKNAVNLPWPGYIDQFVHGEVRGPRNTVMSLQGKRLSLGHGRYPGGDIEPGKSIETELTCNVPNPGDYTIHSYLKTSRSGTPWWKFWEGRVDAKDVVVKVREKKKR
jgi:hypothetical protein